MFVGVNLLWYSSSHCHTCDMPIFYNWRDIVIGAVIVCAIASAIGLVAFMISILTAGLNAQQGYRTFSKALIRTCLIITAVCALVLVIMTPIANSQLTQENARITAVATKQGFTLSAVAPAEVTIFGSKHCHIYAEVDNDTFILAGQPDLGPLTPADIVQLCK